MRCEVITDFERLERLSTDWQRLTASDPRSEVFHNWNWARASWRAYRETSSLLSPVVYDGSKVIGILPLARRGDLIEFLGLPDADYNDVLCEEHATSQVLTLALESILGLSSEWNSCVFDNLSASSRMVRYWPTLPPRLRRHLQSTFQYPSPGIILDHDKEKIINELVKKKDLKRHHNKLRKLGQLTFRHIESSEEARKHIGCFFDQHIARFALNGLRSQFLEAARRNFYEALLDNLDLRKELRFAVLELDGRPVAYHLGFLHNAKFTHYKPTFDVNDWDCSPGDVILLFLFKYVQEADVREFDFSIGDESYKLRFANNLERNFTLHLDRHVPQSCFKRLARTARQYIRQRPRLKKFFNDTALWLKKTALWAVRLVTSPNSLKHCASATGKACRKMVWARDEAVLFCRSSERIAGTFHAHISPESFSSLCELSLQYPEFLSPAKLRDYRRRMQQGDRIFVANRGGKMSIVRVGQRYEISIPELGPGCVVPLGSPALVIEEGVSSADFRARNAPPEFLHALATQSSGQDIWIYCHGHEVALHHAIEMSDFEPRYRVVRTVFLHCFRRTSVSPLLQSAPVEQESSYEPASVLRR
jgi:CelD/BcsL family acetyltransferase involved in cellulose biosynthesis